jgi:hypothetical protein
MIHYTLPPFAAPGSAYCEVFRVVGTDLKSFDVVSRLKNAAIAVREPGVLRASRRGAALA